MESPFSSYIPQGKSQRNAFDLSRKSLFTANIGQLLPFFCQEVQPGDHFEIGENSFTRTRPCNTAAYVRCKEHREFFFVPYRYLWSYWEQFIGQVNDYHSSLMEHHADYKVPHQVPCIDFQTLLKTFVYNADSELDYIGDRTDLSGSYYSTNFARLFNMLGYGHLNLAYNTANNDAKQVDTTVANNVSGNCLLPYQLNPFRILAYQKIYYDYYRKSDWSPNIVSAYNIDYPYTDASGFFPASADTLGHMWTLHYRPYKVDFFTCVRPQTYWYGTTEPNSPSSGVRNDSLVGLPSAYVGTFGTPVIDNSPLAVNMAAGALSVNQIRVAYALDKYLRTSQLAGKHYDDQILAHFGEKVNSDISQETRLIGAFSTPLVISEVTSSADTAQGTGDERTGAAVGQIFGKGIANGTSENGIIKFDAHEHGIIMGIYSVGIESDYSAYGIDPFNLKRSRVDYYTPELDEVGPHVLRPEVINSAVLAASPTSNVRNSVLGLIDPYLEYKVPVDKVFGDFMLDGNMKAWTATRLFGFDPRQLPETSLITSLRISDLYIDPRIMDNIFGIHSALSDQLLIDDYTIVRAVRNMSVHGRPKL